MKKSCVLGIILLFVLAGMAITPVAGDAVMNIYESRISTDPAEQSAPDIDGIHIVYQDNRNGNWDIYLYTLEGTFAPETRITTNTSNQLYPAISGNRIVWQDNRNGNWDIYLYDIGTQNETLLTRSCYPNACPSQYPAIYGDHILYQKTWAPSYSWVPCLFKVDPATKTETYLTVWVNNNNNPDIAIYENRVVWTVYEYIYDGYHTSIWMYDLNTGSMTRITNTWHVMYNEGHPDTDGYAPAYVVYYDNRNHYWGPGGTPYFSNEDIFVYNLDRATETQVTNNTANQRDPAISGGRIVYVDDRNGNWDIYMAMLGWSSVPSAPEPSDNGSLYVASYPTGATILINGTEKGVTNQLVTNVTAGMRNLTLAKDGYQPYTTVVNVPANDVKILAPITLTKGGQSPDGTGTLYVKSYPSGATILINGTDHGMTDKFVTDAPAGNQNLTLVKEGYQPYPLIVNVPAHDVKILAPITLTKGGGVIPPSGTGGLYVASYPKGATILIDGNKSGTTDRLVSGLPAGNHVLALTLAGYQAYTTTVTVPASGVKVLPPISLNPSNNNTAIIDVSPNEGTVGTILTLSGSGFGEEAGEVLLGPGKCDVLAWSDTAITCKVAIPQTAGEYNVTVIAAKPVTFSSFTMLAPEIILADTPSGLLYDNETNTVTIPGDFFGDEMGNVSFVSSNGTTVKANVVDWSMKSIRFQIPDELTGTHVIKVENGVGDALRLIYVDSGMPGDMQDYAYIGDKSHKCAAGVAYNGKFYVFYSHPDCVFCTDSNRIKMKTITYDGYGSEISVSGAYSSIPDGTTDAAVVPLVIEDTMWVFCTGQDGHLHYWRYNVTDHDSKWNHISDVTTDHDWEIAPVYNTVTHRIEVYYEHDRKLNRVYSDDYGLTWIKGGEVTGVGSISTAPSAAFYKKSDTDYLTLLAVGNATNQGYVYDVKDGAVIATRLAFGTVNGRPYIYDTGYWHDEFHLFWRQADNSDVYFKGLYKWNNDAWGPTEKYGCYSGDPTDYCWRSDWAVNAAFWDAPVSGYFEFQFWGYDGHWAMNTVGLPCPPYPHCKGICC
jgi:beta propeller repeat protein